MGWGLIALAGVIAAASGVSAASGIATTSTSAARWLIVLEGVGECLGVDELGLLDELAAADVGLGLLIGDESDVEGLQVGIRREFLLGGSTALLILDGAVEGAQTIDLHSTRVEQHLQHAAAELLEHAEYHVGGVDTAVLGDMSGQLSGVHSLYALGLCKPLAEDLRSCVLVLLKQIKNLCHNCVCY